MDSSLIVSGALTGAPLRSPTAEGLDVLDADEDSANAKDNKSDSAQSVAAVSSVFHSQARSALMRELYSLAHDKQSNSLTIEVLERAAVLRNALLALSRKTIREKAMAGMYCLSACLSVYRSSALQLTSGFADRLLCAHVNEWCVFQIHVNGNYNRVEPVVRPH